MDATIKNKIAEIQKALEQEELRTSEADPIAKMMLVALAHQAREIERKIDSSLERLSELFCDQVLQNSNLHALPAVSVVKIGNSKEYAPYRIDEKTCFTFKATRCNYRPLFDTQILPGEWVAYATAYTLVYPYQEPIKASPTKETRPEEVWLAYDAAGEVNTLEGVMFATSHPFPSTSRLQAEISGTAFPVTPAWEEEVHQLQSDFMLIEFWKRHLIHHHLWLYRFGAAQNDQPVMKSAIPAQLLETFGPEALEPLASHRYLWIKLTAEKGCHLPPDTEVIFNCLPVANYDIASVKLSHTEPIQRLENEKTGAQFLEVVEEPEWANEYFIRDFDVNQYDNNRIREDILNLYRHYVDDYFAFVDSNALHDGTTLKSLRLAMVQIYDALEDFKPSLQKPYRGVYAIRNPRNNQQPIVITYLSTQGERGNLLKKEALLTSSHAAVGEVTALLDAQGGRDKITGPIARRELAKFSVHSNDRLFTQIDILRYCRMEWLRAFGDEALKFCKITTKTGSIPAARRIEKCLFITFEISSEKLFEETLASNFQSYLEINMEMRKSFECEVRVNTLNIVNR